ncbi:MAG: hypothetical protein R3346_04220, partial [Candidatus Spechtbacterales bacterium]|nr:hypothetical protein [Candidatus Spechtbacterales bacterium]
MIIQPSKKKRKRKSSSMIIRRKSPRKKKRALLIKRIFSPLFSRFGLFVFGLLVLLGGLSYFLFSSSQFLITEVNINGVNESLQEDVLAHYKKVASEDLFFFFQKNNALLFPEDKFQESALRAVPKIKNVQTKIELPHALNISAEERIQEGIWCNYHDSINVPKCYFHDTEGVIYEEAPNSARGTLITTIRDRRDKNQNAVLADKVIDNAHIEHISKLVEVLGVAYQKPVYITIHSESELRMGFFDGW